MGVSVKEELVLDGLGKERKESLRMLGQMRRHVLSDIDLKRLCHDLIDLLNEHINLGNELYESLRHQYDAIVLVSFSSLANNISQLLRDLRESHLESLDLLANQDPVYASLESALKSDVRCRPAHEPHEVIVTLARHSVDAEVPYGLRVGLGGRIETEADLDVLIL